MIREPPAHTGNEPKLDIHIGSGQDIKKEHTGNEPTLDIPIGGSGQDIKKEQNGKYMPFVRTC